MASPFGKKLFRLLILFSFVPLLIMGVAGYYLVLETAEWSSVSDDDYFVDLTSYYNEQTFRLIQADLSLLEEDRNTSPFYADHVFLSSGNRHREDSSLPPDIRDEITRLSGYNARGFVQKDGLLYQYACMVTREGSRLIGVKLPGDAYLTLLQEYEHSRTARLSRRQLQRRYGVFLGLILIGLAAATGGLAYSFSVRISRSLSRPIADMSRAAQAIAAGDFKQEIPTGGPGEIQSLVMSFNRMAARLDNTTAKLRQTERVAAWRHIARRFAHELKNPLQPIMVCLYRIEKALDRGSIDENVKQGLRAASEEIEHLTALADRYANLAKLPPPKPARTDLCRLLSSEAHLYQEKLAAFEFILEVPEKPVWVLIDATYFREALHNLLNNAMEASTEGGRIILGLQRTPDEARIKVQDFGEGMSEATQAAAYMPYFTTKKSGTGLGLAIVEKTVSEAGGYLSIESKPNAGTTVTVHLPGTGENEDAGTNSHN